MNLLEILVSLISTLGISIETGVFSGEAPTQYLVLVPVSSNYELYADNIPQDDVEEVRVSIYSKTNYLNLKKQLEKTFIKNGLTITDRRYNGFEKETKYHHYTIDVAKDFYLEED